MKGAGAVEPILKLLEQRGEGLLVAEITEATGLSAYCVTLAVRFLQRGGKILVEEIHTKFRICSLPGQPVEAARQRAENKYALMRERMALPKAPANRLFHSEQEEPVRRTLLKKGGTLITFGRWNPGPAQRPEKSTGYTSPLNKE